MFFTQLEFLFFGAALLILLGTVRGNTAYKSILLTASLLFYGYWDIRFLLLLLSCVAVNYFCGKRIVSSGRNARAYLWTAILFDVSLLAIFKYYNFFASNLGYLLAKFGVRIGLLEWVLPLGISFFTFQSISYVVDTYRNSCEIGQNSAKLPSLLDFSLFILYFPKLTVGPIVRAQDFLPQLAKRPSRNFEMVFSGVRQFLFGLFEKIMVADYLALFVDRVFNDHTVFSGATLFVALAAYTLQIYCDFCGYSDMAIGCSRVLGYELCENFNLPYLAESVTDFWRRWHISLSSWLRDYIYIPLGGNRHGFRRSCLNSFVTMLIGGLWHGANWTFVVWGGWHGAALTVHRLWKKYGDGFWHLPRFCAFLLTLATVMIGWLFFRAATISQALSFLGRMVTFSSGISWFEPVSLCIIAGAVVCHIAAFFGWHRVWRECRPNVAGFALLWLMFLAVLVFRPSGFHPFVYNQF